MKFVDVKPSIYIDFIWKNDHIYKIGNHVTIIKYKNIFEKSYIPNWPKEF